MQISLLLALQILKLFAIMLMGYAIVKLGLLKASDSKALSVVLVYLIMPCVIINAFQVEATTEVQKGLALACVAAVAVHILFLVITIPLRKLLHLNAIEQASCIYPNAGILVIPLVQVLLGQEYVIYCSAFVAIQLILLWSHGKFLLCEEKKIDWKKVLLNVNILSILVGVILFLLHIELPGSVQDVLVMMNNMIGPTGMILAGMAIAETPLKRIVLTRHNYVTVVLRLMVYPLLALLLMKPFLDLAQIPHADAILLTVFLPSITPACATITSMAQLYDRDAAYASSLYVLTTLLSIFTMPCMVFLYETLK